MKERIKEVIDSDGKKTFYPQYQGWFGIWRNFEWSEWSDAHFDTLAEAKKWLDYDEEKEMKIHSFGEALK